MMTANLQANHHIISISRRFLADRKKQQYPVQRTSLKQRNRLKITSLSERSSSSSSNGSALVQQRPPKTHDDVAKMMDRMAVDDHDGEVGSKEFDGYLVREYGWKVRRMVEDKTEMWEVAQIQAEAFHVPTLFFDEWFFQFFQAEVLSGLLYRLRNSPPDRYACLVAEPAKADEASTKLQLQNDHHRLVGVVDVTVLRDNDVLQHLEGAEEYLYISGIAVSNNNRRQKVATVLLKACEVISVLWGYEYLVLRAYEDDNGARALYTNAGYRLVSRDPPWVTWIGRKRRILMIKRL